MIKSLLALSAIAVIACQVPAQSRWTCSPPDTSARFVSGSALAGRYLLTFSATSGDLARRTAVGMLLLMPRDSASRVLRDGRGEANPHFSELYFGFAEIALDSVGVYTNGVVDSRSTSRPGVVIREHTKPRPDAVGENYLAFELGAQRNRRVIVTLDGGYTRAQIRERVLDGFRGTWETRAGSGIVQCDGIFLRPSIPAGHPIRTGHRFAPAALEVGGPRHARFRSRIALAGELRRPQRGWVLDAA